MEALFLIKIHAYMKFQCTLDSLKWFKLSHGLPLHCTLHSSDVKLAPFHSQFKVHQNLSLSSKGFVLALHTSAKKTTGFSMTPANGGKPAVLERRPQQYWQHVNLHVQLPHSGQTSQFLQFFTLKLFTFKVIYLKAILSTTQRIKLPVQLKKQLKLGGGGKGLRSGNAKRFASAR